MPSRPTGIYGLTVNFLLLTIPLAAARIATPVVAVTVRVVIENPCVLVPAGNTRVATSGCATVVLLLESATTMSPGAAAQSNVTVPATGVPPVTGFGDRVIVFTEIGRTDNDRCTDCGPTVAVMTPVVVLVTGVVAIGKVIDVLPAGTTTDAGTEPAAFELSR